MFKNKYFKYFSILTVIITISLGWYYPKLAFIVPLVMITAITIGLINGRYHCGNICPRGLFLNLSLPFISRNKEIPGILKNMKFRVSMIIFMMSFMSFMLSKNISSLNHWGTVFWTMCTVTTLIGIILGTFFKPRTWCSFCPIGTMQHLLNNHKEKLTLDSDKCKSCKLCEKKCPMNLTIIDKEKKTDVHNKDCIKCSVCVGACPVKALDLKKSA